MSWSDKKNNVVVCFNSGLLLVLPLVRSTIVVTRADPIVVNEGDTFTFDCTIRNLYQGDLLQFVRGDVIISSGNAQSFIHSHYNITVNGTEFPADFTDSRFNATLDLDGTTATYTLVIASDNTPSPNS